MSMAIEVMKLIWRDEREEIVNTLFVSALQTRYAILFLGYMNLVAYT